MVTVIFRAKMRAGKENEALERMREMVAAVQAQEPGALAYIFHRSKDDPAEIVFYEHYADDGAFQAHAQTPHMGETRAAFGELFDTATVKLERLERVAGFAQEGANRSEHAGTVTLIFRAKMQTGKEETVLRQLQTTIDAVQAQEPGAVAYLWHHPQDALSELVLFEVWADDAALQAHMKTSHMAEFWASYAELFDAPQSKVERLERVAGFVRAG